MTSHTAATTRPTTGIPTDVLVALGLVYAIWSSTYLAIRVMVHDLPPFASGGFRYVLAGTLLLVIQRARGAPFPTAKQWASALPIGALLFAVGNGLVASAERSIGSGIAAVVCGTTPLWAGVIGPVFGERATRREWIGMGLGFAGVIVLSVGGDLRSDPLAAALLVLAPIGWATASLWSRKLSLAPGPSGAATQMVGGGAVMLCVSAVIGEGVPTDVGAGSIAAFVYLTLIGSLVAFSAYAYLLQNARPALAMSYAYVNPVLAVVLGAVLGAEQVGVEVIVATTMIVAAVFLLIRGRTPARA